MLVTAEMMSPEFILRNFWWYHLKPEVELEKTCSFSPAYMFFTNMHFSPTSFTNIRIAVAVGMLVNKKCVGEELSNF